MVSLRLGIERDKDDRSEAMRGNFIKEDVKRRLDAHVNTPIVGPGNGHPIDVTKEDEIDFKLRRLASVSNGFGNAGVQYGLTVTNYQAFFEMASLVKSLRSKGLPSDNGLLVFCQNEFNLWYNEIFGRAMDSSTLPPEQVLTEKPWIYPGGAPPPPSNADEQASADKKKP